MRAHRALGHLEEDRPVALAALVPGDRLDVDRVSDEVRLQHAVFVEPAAAGEVAFLAFEAVGEDVRIVHDEVFAMKEIKDERRGRHRDDARLAVALAVEVLIIGIEWNGEEAALLPLEALLRPVFLPHRRRAAPFEDIDQFLEEMALRAQTLSRRDAAYVSVVEITRAFEIDEDAVAAHPLPPFERHVVDVLDAEAFDYVDPLRR